MGAANVNAVHKRKMNMKSIIKSRIYLTIAGMFLTLALVGQAAAQKQVPFRGSVQGSEIDVFQGPPPGTLAVDGSLTGVATQLGQLTLTYELTVNLADGSATGSGELIAANGDIIFTTIVGQGEPTDTPGLNHIVEIYTITAGTGRFAPAEGSFTLDRLVDLTTGVTSGSFHGTITSPGAAHLRH
jgi:hypothetical protein